MLFSFSSIPYNCFEDVFKKVGFPELCRCRRTCKAMDEIIKKKINQGLRIQIETDPMASLYSFPHFHTLDWVAVFCNYLKKYRVQLNYKEKETILTDARQLDGARLSTLTIHVIFHSGGKLREFKLYSIICKIEVDKKDPWLAANELYRLRHEHEKLNLYGYLIRNNRGNFLVLAGEKAIEGYIVEDVDTTVNLAMNHLDKEMAMYPSMLSEWKMECTEMLRANYENCTKS